MKIQGFENLPEDPMPLEKALEQAVAEDDAVLKPEVRTPPVKIDRRQKMPSKSEAAEDPDEKYFRMAEEELINSGQKATPEAVRSTAFKIKFQEIPSEELAGKVVDAMMTDSERSKQIKEKTQAGLTGEFLMAEARRKKEKEAEFEIEQERKREEAVRVRAEQSRKTAEIIKAAAAKKAQNRDRNKDQPLAA